MNGSWEPSPRVVIFVPLKIPTETAGLTTGATNGVVVSLIEYVPDITALTVPVNHLDPQRSCVGHDAEQQQHGYRYGIAADGRVPPVIGIGAVVEAPLPLVTSVELVLNRISPIHKAATIVGHHSWSTFSSMMSAISENEA